MTTGFDVASLALARIEDFSAQEREAILALVRIGRGQATARPRSGVPLPVLVDRPFRWAEFDRWHALFTARGTFPTRWDGLQVIPPSGAPATLRVAYRQRKLDLLVEWLGLLTWRVTELSRYTRQGVRTRIVRQEDGGECPVCESVTPREVSHEGDILPPLHPGCRCVLMSAMTPEERTGTRVRYQSRSVP